MKVMQLISTRSLEGAGCGIGGDRINYSSSGTGCFITHSAVESYVPVLLPVCPIVGNKF